MKLKLRVILNVKTDVLRDIIIDSSTSLIEFSNIITNKVNFDIEFSDKGFVLGNVNLLEQKAN